MNKDNIPTTKITYKLEKEEKEIEVYKWLTQDEANEYQRIIYGDQEVDVNPNTDVNDISLKVRIGTSGEMQKYVIGAACKDFTYEDFNILSPEIRVDIYTKVMKVIDKKK